jgi:UDP-3-O-[3-hydroxymyristoyl] glucosamine N-acyltransferase
MQLSELSQLVKIKVLRDGQFDSLGLLSHNLDKMLVALYDSNYLDKVALNPYITCAITTSDIASKLPEHLAVGVCEDPKTAFYQIHCHLFKKTNFYWEDFESEISPDAVIHERAYIAPRNVRIGPGSIVEPNSVILERSILSENVIIRAGAVIGGEGFEPKYIEGKHVLVPHAGGVLLHNGVEIQANSHVARSVFGTFTEVGEDTKVDALVHIGHNVRIGSRCEICAFAGIAGSTVIGDDVFIGGQSAIFPELRIGNNAFIGMGSLIRKDVADYAMVAGSPARFVRWLDGAVSGEGGEDAK